MSQIVTLYSVFFLAASLISLFVAFLAWQRRSVNAASELTQLMISDGIWSFLVIFETDSTTEASKILWAKIGYLGAVTTPVFYLFFVVRFTGKDLFNTFYSKLLLFIIPAITAVLAFTNDSHKLIWTGFSPISTNTNLMEYYHGPAFWIGYMGYNYLILFIATVFLFRFIIQNSKGFYVQGIIVFIAALFPWTASVFYLSGINVVPGFDLVPGSMVLSGILFAVAILYNHFIDLAPVARETLVENLTDGILVLDAQNRIQDINEAAISFLGIKKRNIIGIPVQSSDASSVELIKELTKEKTINEIVTPIAGELKTFSIIKQNIKNHKGSRLLIIRDITSQKSSQNALAKSEKKYRELTEFLPEMICELDFNGNVTYANQFALEKFGYRKDEVLDKAFSIFKIFDESERFKIADNIKQLLDKGDHLANEYSAIKKNKEKFPVIVYSTPIIEEDVIIGIRGVMVDITDRKNSELEIARNLKQQEILSNISLNYNSLQDFENKTNETLRIIGEHLNVSRVYIFENSADGLTSSNTYEWCNTSILAQIENLQNIPYSLIPSWKKLLVDDGIVYSEDISEMPQDIREILEPQSILSIIVLPIILNGKFHGFIGFDECVSKRAWTKSELELLRTISNLISNAFLRNKINSDLINSVNENKGIINSIPDQIVRMSDTGMILSHESSKQSTLFSNLKYGDNDHISNLLNAELSNSFLSAIKVCLAEGAFKFDFNILDGIELKHYEARFVKLKVTEVLAIIRDVTEIKENEKELQIAKIRAEDASRAKSEFLANVSHEIRTPMNAILGFSEWLHENVKDPQHKSYLHTILNSGKNLLALINDILDLSKIESGKINIQLEPMQCELVIQEIKQVLKQKLETKNLTLNISIDPSVPAYIYMDEIRFYQILFNLIDNAIKYTIKGFIHVSAFTTKTTSDDLINLIIMIEDTGIGIQEDQQERIFSAFTQQSGQSNRYYEGTGLGLAIVNGLLKGLNGDIKLKSKVGKGSTFTATFKEVKIAEDYILKQAAAENQNLKIIGSCKIMIVDDVDFNIQVLKRIVYSDGIIFLEAKDGEQALQMIETETPDIIFMDIRMPGMNGYDVTEIIRRNEKHKNIPVIAFTASTMDDEKERIDNTFDAFLQKPVFRKEVMAVMTKFLSHKYIRDEKPKTIEIQELDLSESIENLPEIIQKLDEQFLPHWESIKNDLIIFDIEDFNNKLSDFATDTSCRVLSRFSSELNQVIQAFDIELIKSKLNEFPDVVSKINELNK